MTSFRKRLKTLPAAWRWLLGIITALAVLLVIAQLITSIFLDDMLGSYLKQQVRLSTSNRYSIEYEDLDIGLLGRSIEAENLQLNSDSSASANTDPGNRRLPVLGEARIAALQINGVSLWGYFFNNALSIGSIQIHKPELDAEIRNTGTSKKSGQQFSSVDSSLYSMLSQQFQAFRLDDFEIQDASFNIKRAANTERVTVRSLNLRFQNIYIDSSTAQSGRFFITDDIEFDVSGLTMNLPQGFYHVDMKAFELSSSKQVMKADSLQLTPRFPRYEFSSRKGHEIDRIELLIPSINLEGIDFSQLAGSNRFYAKLLDITQAELDVFHNKKDVPPSPKRIKPLPHVSFRKLSFPIRVDTIQIRQTDIKYTEHAKDVPDPGTISFENIKATIAALSNYPEDLESGHQVRMNTSTNIMGQGRLNATFDFYMHDLLGNHSIEGNFGPMEISELNPILENLAFIKVDQGYINSMKFSMSLDRQQAAGQMTLNYEALNLKLLKSETLEQDTGQQIKSFIANTFVVKADNNVPPLRQGEISLERNPHKSIFNYWWKALSTGLKDSIGL